MTRHYAMQRCNGVHVRRDKCRVVGVVATTAAAVGVGVCLSIVVVVVVVVVVAGDVVATTALPMVIASRGSGQCWRRRWRRWCY